jgi:spore coat polysaccharide biosynthesis predicted glycosyltransferase SpsG
LNKKNNILICPLEWGLGHAGRMIPLARKLQECNNSIFIGAGREHQMLFRNELSEITYIDFQGFKPGYSRFLPPYITLFLKIPVLIFHIIAEHLRLRKIIKENNIDIVISDNRFGLWNRKIRTVYVTHQLRIPFPGKLKLFERTGILLHRFFIKKYSFCFIPDFPGVLNISGRLSHDMDLPENARFIGILSRFMYCAPSPNEKKIDFPHNTIILSGPEPQRGILKNKLVELLQDKEPATVILEGKPDAFPEVKRAGNIISYNHLSTGEMQEMITGSSLIITRSGYTIVMELISLNRSALLIPTPGQTEQEYLAQYLSAKGWFTAVPQKSLGSGLVLTTGRPVNAGELITESRILLEKALVELLK